MPRPGRGAQLLAPGVPARRHSRNGGPHWSSNEVEKVERVELWIPSQPDAAGEVFKLDIGGAHGR